MALVGWPIAKVPGWEAMQKVAGRKAWLDLYCVVTLVAYNAILRIPARTSEPSTSSQK